MSKLVDRAWLSSRLQGIEWDDLEAKSAQGGVPHSAYTSVSAFANTDGGWIVLGVNDTPQGLDVIGLKNPDVIQNDFLSTCRSTDKFSRPIDVQAELFSIDNKPVLAFYIAPASRLDKPVRVRVGKHWKTYTRVGACDQECNKHEEGRFLRDATTDTFDAQVMGGASFSDLNPDSIAWIRGLIQTRNPQRPLSNLSDFEFLDELGLLYEGNVTHAAALFVGKPKLIARIKPAGIVDYRFLAETWDESVPAHRYDDRILAEDNIVETLQAILQKFHLLVPHPFQLDPSSLRRESQDAAFTVLREALVNLLIHQDYADKQRTARILYYQDRIIFENPGDSYVRVRDMLQGGASDLRNPHMTRIMRLIGYAEQAGTGLSTILAIWRQTERKPPRIENDVAKKIFRLTLDWTHAPFLRTNQLKELGVDISLDAERLLLWLYEVGPRHQSEARLATGTSASETRGIVKTLYEKGLLVKVHEKGDVYDLSERAKTIVSTSQIHPRPAKSDQDRPSLAQSDLVSDQVEGKSDREPTKKQPRTDQEPTKNRLRTDQDENVLISTAHPIHKVLLGLVNGPKSAAELQGLMELTHRPSFRKEYLHVAMEEGWIAMTIPDKPTSRNQKYQLTKLGRERVNKEKAP